MSNAFKDWYNDFSEEEKKNYELCMQYPILIPHSRWLGTVSPDFNYERTELDSMPDGWRIAFGEQWAKDIQDVLNKIPEDVRDMVYITDIKEKFGYLHSYFSYYTDELNDVVRKYENLSKRICIRCGAPATKMSTGWISPWCDNCAMQFPGRTVSIEEWLERDEYGDN